MSLPAALVIAGICIGIGVAVGLVGAAYFLYRMFCVLAAALTGDAVTMRRALAPKPAKAPEGEQKTVAEIPELGIHALGEKEEVMRKLRQKQDSTDDDSAGY